LVHEEDGVRAEAVLRRDNDGAILSRAFGFVGYNEDHAEKYAVEGKAQTRAVSRVCRHKFAFVVTLIDADLQTTPAEEVPKGGFDDAPNQQSREWLGRAMEVQQSVEARKREYKLDPNTTDPIKFEGVLERYNNDGKFFSAFVDGNRVWTSDEGFGRAMEISEGKEVIATCRVYKGKKSGKMDSFKVIALRPTSLDDDIPMGDTSNE
jgi:hypothetical protein